MRILYVVTTIPTPGTYRSHNVPDSLVSGSTPRVILFVDLESSSLNERGLTVSGIEKPLTTTYIISLSIHRHIPI